IVAVGAAEARELSSARVPDSPAAAAALIPKGSCLVADQVSFAIAANRFTAPGPGCPDVGDSLATTLPPSGGGSPQRRPRAAVGGRGWEGWERVGAAARSAWRGGLQAWLNGHFRQMAAFPGYGDSKLYVRR